ncbi:MAG: hypothetical protein Tsb0020_24020 [Haliangiales bacterium]
MSGDRYLADRDQLAVGVRVQLSWVRHAPHTQRAELAVDDRLAQIVAREAGDWIAEDDAGRRYQLGDAQLEEPAADPASGRWRIEGAIPTYALGERLRLSWRHRNRAIPTPPRPDQTATVVTEATHTVTVALADGSRVMLFRWGFQADERDPRAPRWFVTGRLGPADSADQ